jgi:hypothetical protein
VNNCWTDLDEHTIFLEPPNEKQICKSKTQTFSFSHYYAHSLIAINFKIEYTASLPTLNTASSYNRESKATVCVAYGSFMPRIVAGSVDEQNIDFFCEMGPAITTTEDVVWTEDPNYKSGIQVRLAGKFSTSQNAGVFQEQAVSLPTGDGEIP